MPTAWAARPFGYNRRQPEIPENAVPIYAYRCTSCGFEKDVMQKVSDPLLTTCPACGAETFAKQLSAPGFQLKGSGWYATDFKGSGTAKPTGANSSAETKPESAAASSGTTADAVASAPSSAGSAATSATDD
jgi:putative FmdB family regulatory protein